MNRKIMNTFFTKNGHQIRVRPMLPEDAPYLVDLFENMSDDSRYRRFNQTLDRVDIDRIWSEAEQIAQGIATNSYGLLAFTDLKDRMEVPVAGARFVKLTHAQAEIAISVRDDMQGTGIGTQLFSLLIDEARRQGINVLIGSVQNDNRAVWTILKKLSYRINRQPEGNSTSISIHLDEPDGQADVSSVPQLERH
jgi:RimJ/RimL family protein N-acetyltransferase